MNELVDTRGSHIYDIEFDSGSEFRVAGNTIEDVISDIKEYCDDNNDHNGEEFTKFDYTIKAKVRTDEYDPQTQMWDVS